MAKNDTSFKKGMAPNPKGSSHKVRTRKLMRESVIEAFEEVLTPQTLKELLQRIVQKAKRTGDFKALQFFLEWTIGPVSSKIEVEHKNLIEKFSRYQQLSKEDLIAMTEKALTGLKKDAPEGKE